MRSKTLGFAAACVACAFGHATAQDIGIASRKLVIVDKLVAAGKAKTVYVAADPAITKGSGTDVGSISFGLSTSYQSALGPTTGTFAANIGGFNGVAGWTANKDGVAKYVNKLPLDGPSDVKVAVIKPGTSLKMVGLSLGDSPIDLINTGVPLSDVCVLVSIVNATTLVRLCSRFQPPTVQFREIAQGTGRKLVARVGVADPSCAVCGSGPPVPTTTTTTIISITTTSVTTSITVTTTTTSTTVPLGCVATSGTFCDLGDGTVYDSATGLQWEKKTTTVGSGQNAADVHDVDNLYTWAGWCSVATSKYCQPTLAAENLCKAQTPSAYWAYGCEQCSGGEGTCNVDPLSNGTFTTVWDWLDQVRTANYAGHNDWRLPSESGCNSCYVDPTFSCTTCSAHELETLLLSSFPCGASPCIASIFGPTAPTSYWSSTTYTVGVYPPEFGWQVTFGPSNGAGITDKVGDSYIRAVRDGP